MGAARIEMLIPVQPDGPRTGEILRDWLDIGFNVFGGAIAAAAWARAPLPERAPLGRSGDAWADFWVIHKPSQSARRKALSVEKWEAFRQQAIGLPPAVEIRVRTIGADGQPGMPGMAVKSTVHDAASLTRFADEPVTGQWLQLVAFLPSVWLADETIARGFTAKSVRTGPPQPSHTATRVGSHRTEPESACPGGRPSPRTTFPSLDASCGAMGGSPCARELGEQLGGADAVRATGLCSVVALEHGGLWLQATPSYDEYDIVAARRVFRALSPVLVAGTPIVLAHGDEAAIVAEHPRPGETPPPPAPAPYRRPVDGPTISSSPRERSSPSPVPSSTGGSGSRTVSSGGPSAERARAVTADEILAQLAVWDDNFTVGEWRIEGGTADRPRYRAVLVQ